MEGLDCATVPAAVRMLGVRDAQINCSFAHLGGAGLSFAGGTQGSSVRGCEFLMFQRLELRRLGDEFVFSPRPRPADGGISIHDNHIHSVAVEYFGAVGILSTFTAGLSIVHNTIHNIPYSCMSLGWSAWPHVSLSRLS